MRNLEIALEGQMHQTDYMAYRNKILHCDEQWRNDCYTPLPFLFDS